MNKEYEYLRKAYNNVAEQEGDYLELIFLCVPIVILLVVYFIILI